MPIKFECPKCGRKLSIDAERAGKSVRCPGCKSIVKAAVTGATPLSLDDAEPLPPRIDLIDERDEDSEEIHEDNRPRPLPRRSKWNGIASGISALQVGLVVLAVAETVFVAAPYLASLGKLSIEAIKMFVNLLLFSFLMAVASSACFCFGHMSGSTAPDPASKKLATWSLGISTLAILFWTAFLGSLSYLRIRIVHLVENPSEAVWVMRIISASFILAIVALWSAELVFLRLLRRVAWLFDSPKLLAWAKGVFLALAILLGIFVLFMGYNIIETERNIRQAGFDRLSRNEAQVIVFSLYAITIGFQGCYFYALLIAKRVLYGMDEARERDDDYA